MVLFLPLVCGAVGSVPRTVVDILSVELFTCWMDWQLLGSSPVGTDTGSQVFNVLTKKKKKKNGTATEPSQLFSLFVKITLPDFSPHGHLHTAMPIIR